MAVAVQIRNGSRVDVLQGVRNRAQVGRWRIELNGVFHEISTCERGNVPTAHAVGRACHKGDFSTWPAAGMSP